MERFSRTEKLLGSGKLKKLSSSSVLLVGAGAVGSYAAEGLARSGVGKITVVDFDTVNITNINRQLYALESTIGKPKVELAAARLTDINPACEIKALNLFADAQSIPALLAEKPDLIVDAIDSVASKVELLARAVEAGIPVVSSMGAARRTNPLAVQVGSIFKTTGCPLARQIRKSLRQRGVRDGITAVFSTETVDSSSHSRLHNEDGSTEKVLGSLPTVTGIFGLVAADTAVKFLLESC